MSHAPTAWLASAYGFSIAMSLSPGPNNAMLAASGATWGFRRSVPHMAGVSLGFPLMLIAVALGLDRAFAAAPVLQRALTAFGIAYLLWLAWKIATAPTGDPDEGDAPTRPGRPLGFGQAAAFQWVNPKAWIVCLGAVALYARPGPGRLGDALALAAVFVSVTPAVVSFWVLAGIGSARLLRTPRARAWFNRAMAALLVASLAPLAAEPADPGRAAPAPALKPPAAAGR